MNKHCSDDINTYSEKLEPLAALYQALEDIEVLKSKVETLEKELESKDALIEDASNKIAELGNNVDNILQELKYNKDAHIWLREKIMSLMPESDSNTNRGELLISHLTRKGSIKRKKAVEMLDISQTSMNRLLRQFKHAIEAKEDPDDSRGQILYLREEYKSLL